MAGIGTVLADDPMLNVRIPGLKSPVRIICDSGLEDPDGFKDRADGKGVPDHRSVCGGAFRGRL